MTNSAYLVELYDKDGTLVKRRIAMSTSSALTYLEQFAKKHDATMFETFSDRGFIDNGTDKFWDYNLTNIAIV